MASFSFQYPVDEIIVNLKEEVRAFESNLDTEHDSILRLISFGNSFDMSVVSVSQKPPDLICFHGLVDNQEATLIQHIYQLKFLLIAAEKADKSRPPHRIGFAYPQIKE